MWYFVTDALDKPLNSHLLEFANSIPSFGFYTAWLLDLPRLMDNVR
jgi:hypothetical protein